MENTSNITQIHYRKDYWTGHSRDGEVKNGDGFHYFKMSPCGTILEAFEIYETEDGDPVVCPLPEMQNVNWLNDLGFQDLEVLEDISEMDFQSMKELVC